MRREELLEALDAQDWEAVALGGAVLYGKAHCSQLGEAARDASQAAFFVLENPAFGAVAEVIARIAADQLKNV